MWSCELTLTFDLLTYKLLLELYVTWVTSNLLPNFGHFRAFPS